MGGALGSTVPQPVGGNFDAIHSPSYGIEDDAARCPIHSAHYAEWVGNLEANRSRLANPAARRRWWSVKITLKIKDF
jgi:hypothetical protein